MSKVTVRNRCSEPEKDSSDEKYSEFSLRSSTGSVKVVVPADPALLGEPTITLSEPSGGSELGPLAGELESELRVVALLLAHNQQSYYVSYGLLTWYLGFLSSLRLADALAQLRAGFRQNVVKV
jgi:hypothetical protein